MLLRGVQNERRQLNGPAAPLALRFFEDQFLFDLGERPLYRDGPLVEVEIAPLQAQDFQPADY